jgi:hypothetical protein
LTVASVVMTLFESGSHEEGVAALLNSLCEAGFRGNVWLGVSGPVPSWLTPASVESWVGTQFVVCVAPVTADGAQLLRKPQLMSFVAKREPKATSYIYFDPDVVVKCRWSFVERWCARGVAAVADKEWCLAASSPVRSQWSEWRESLGIGDAFDEPSGPVNVYCNAGFVGVSADCVPFIGHWRRLAEAACGVEAEGAPAVSTETGGEEPDLDRQVFNIALMAWGRRAHLMGPEAMDFAPGGYVFSHAIGQPKPWRRHFIRGALVGRPPSKRDREHWRYRAGPIHPASDVVLRWKRLSYKVGRGLGVVTRR